MSMIHAARDRPCRSCISITRQPSRGPAKKNATESLDLPNIKRLRRARSLAKQWHGEWRGEVERGWKFWPPLENAIRVNRIRPRFRLNKLHGTISTLEIAVFSTFPTQVEQDCDPVESFHHPPERGLLGLRHPLSPVPKDQPRGIPPPRIRGSRRL